MARSEFRWNKKRKHYAYLFKDNGSKRNNILISSKDKMIERKNKARERVLKNIHLHRHPNPNKEGDFYIIPKSYIDDISSFGEKTYKWNWDKNDKRIVKRIKKKSATTPSKVNHRLKPLNHVVVSM